MSDEKMEIEQVKDAETPEEMRAEIRRMAMYDPLTSHVMRMSNMQVFSDEDRYTILAYFLLKSRQESLQRELNTAMNALTKPMKNKEFDEISKMQYASLRKNFNKLIRDVLGDDYYNMAMDVYDADRICCEDIAIKANRGWFERLIYNDK